MTTLVERVGGDRALAGALEILREKKIEVEETPYLQCAERIYFLVVLGRIWEGIVEVITKIGRSLHSALIRPLFEDPVMASLRMRSEMPARLTPLKGRGGLNAFLQMAAGVESLGSLLSGFYSLNFVFESLPLFEQKSRCIQGELKRKSAEEKAWMEIVAAETSGAVLSARRESVDVIDEALRKGDSFKEALEIEGIRNAASDPEIQKSVVGHLTRVNRLALFFQDYRKAQSDGKSVLTCPVEAFLREITALDLEDADVVELFEKVVHAAPLPTSDWGFLEERESLIATGRTFIFPKLQRKPSIRERGERIEEVLSKSYQKRAPESGGELFSPKARVVQEFQTKTAATESRTFYLPLHLSAQRKATFEELVISFSRPPLSHHFSYVSQSGRHCEYQSKLKQRLFIHSPRKLFFSLDRFQVKREGIKEAAIVFLNQPLDVPLSFRLPSEISQSETGYRLTAFIAYRKKEYAFYRQVEEREWVEVIQNHSRGVPFAEASRILSENAVLLHYVAS